MQQIPNPVGWSLCMIITAGVVGLTAEVEAVDTMGTHFTMVTKAKGSATEDDIHRFTRRLDELLSKSVREFEQAVPKIEQELQHLERSVERLAPELRQRFEGLIHDLNERLQRQPRPRNHRDRELAV